MKTRSSGRFRWCLVAFLFLLTTPWLRPASAAGPTTRPDPNALLRSALDKWIELLEPPAGQPIQAFSAKVRMVKSEGLPAEAANLTADVALQAPDRLRASALVGGQTYAVGRDGQQLWVHEPEKKFALVGVPGVPRFKADPASIDHTTLPPFESPISRLKLRVVLLMVNADYVSHETIGGAGCHVLRVTISPKATEWFNVALGPIGLWLRDSDLMPLRATYTDGGRLNVRADVLDPKVTNPWPDEKWKLVPNPGDKVQTVAVSHLMKFLEVAPRIAQQQVPTLGPATGKRHLVASSGDGRLEMFDGARVLFLKGSPEEMGRQHGRLLKSEIHDVSDRILYGVGVGSSFAKGDWFFGEIESAQARLLPFMDGRYLREEDAVATAAGMHTQEARLANFFPELFHCSGFALMGAATKDGHVYHGRVLDYLRGVGLEENAVLIVHQPDDGRHAWVNVSYAGFVGSVTAMNEKGISIGEMGGQGAGKWDGKPMAHLVREVMEKASTLDEAVAIMRDSPRTCEYYYVISDGKTRTAVGIAATPDKFVTLKPGEAHPLLPHAIPDAVVLSAGDRYEELTHRVKADYGKFDADTARELMTRPVCMTSNIQSVLFRPDTLDLWVANADSKNVASATRYTHYNLKELLKAKSAEVGF